MGGDAKRFYFDIVLPDVSTFLRSRAYWQGIQFHGTPESSQERLEYTAFTG